MGESKTEGTEGEEIYQGIVSLGNGVEIIGERAFQGCTGLFELVIPDSVKEIGTRAFYKCENLRSLTIGSGLTSIPDYAFYSCLSLESLTIPSNVTYVGKYAFRGCNAMKTLTIEEGVEELDNFAFYGCTALEALVIPKSMKTIGDYAFRGAESATSIVLPATLEYVGKHVFYGTGATIYCEAETVPAIWHERWNSSFAPLIVGCTLSEDKTYVVSFVLSESNPDNLMPEQSITAPARNNYTFLGFSTVSGSSEIAYTAETLKDAPAGTTVYTVWAQDNTTTE